MLTRYKLPFGFDTELLKADLQFALSKDWAAHFNTNYYEGDWSGIALRSADGNPAQLYPDPSKTTFVDTPVLAGCLYFQEVLATFKCPVESARLLRLSPGSTIVEHKDYNLSLEDGMVRIHIPICTNPRVEFFVDNERLVMEEGEAWYINFNLPHRVHNRSDKDRIHLVFDCVVNDWLSSLIPRGGPVGHQAEPGPAPTAAESSDESKERFEEFRQVVLQDTSLQKQLRETHNLKAFLSLILQLGEERGYSFTAEDVEDALRKTRRAWHLRWT